MNKDELKSYVTKRVNSRFPAYSCNVSSSHQDDSILRVKIFNVPKQKFSETKDFVYSLEQELKLDNFILSPVVKDAETTRIYYSEYYKPKECPLKNGLNNIPKFIV